MSILFEQKGCGKSSMPRKKDSSFEDWRNFANDSQEYKSILREFAEFEDAWRDLVLECYYALKIDLVFDFLANIMRRVMPK